MIDNDIQIKYTIKGQNVSKQLVDEFGVSREMTVILANRGIDTLEKFKEYTQFSVQSLHAPELLLNMDKACSMLMRKVAAKRRIRIIGDYDVDGIMSTTILVKGLSSIGANVSYGIPDRVIDGYGINERLVDKAIEDGIEVIITCDNGISAVEPLKKATDAGILVVVTDHHEPPEILPEVYAIIDQKQQEDTYPCKHICGATVAFKLIVRLYQMMGYYEDNNSLNLTEKGTATGAADYEDLLQFAGFATVCDVVPLLDENRAIVSMALPILRRTANLGLMAIKNAAKLNSPYVSAYHLGFVLGPCFNACGRLASAETGVELLLDDNNEKCAELAEYAAGLNEERKKQTLDGTELAVSKMEEEWNPENPVLTVYLENVHESVIGIIAGKLKERFFRPTFVFTDTVAKNENGEEIPMLKASGRSIKGYNMFEELNKCKEVLEKFGGHELAAGLSVKKENYKRLVELLNANSPLTKDDLIPKKSIDLFLPVSEISERFINELEIIEPTGQSNPKPVIADREIAVVRFQLIGKIKKYIKLVLKKNGKVIEGLYFGEKEKVENRFIKVYGGEMLGKMYDRYYELNEAELPHATIVYKPGINEYNGIKSIQAIIDDIWF